MRIRQDKKLKKNLYKSGLIYLTKTKTLMMKHNSFQGSKSFGIITPLSRSINIDNINDFNFAELILKKKFKLYDF